MLKQRVVTAVIAALTLLADMGKGAGAVLIVRAMTDPTGFVDPALAAAGGPEAVTALAWLPW